MVPRKLDENIYKTYVNSQDSTQQLDNVTVLAVTIMH